MKTLIPLVLALCASWSAPALAAAPSKGSKVFVPPLMSKLGTKISKPTVIRLPSQAGKVSKVVTTTLVAKGPSWIAKGDKYYSLCVPNRRMVACAPIVAASVMKGIEVGAVAGAKGEPLITFKMDSVGLTPKRAAYAVKYFLARASKQVAHFNRMAVSYAPAPQQSALRVGPASNYRDSDGGGCSYEDLGMYDCSGGDYSGGYGGGDMGGYGGGYDPIPNEPAGQCEGACNYPGGDNGNDDPCIAPDGSRICNSPDDIPAVPVPGERPPAEEPMSMPYCRMIGPGVVQCGNMPTLPPFSDPVDIPRPVPWFPQSWCNTAHMFCSNGQEPVPEPVPEDNDRGRDSSTSGKTMSQLYDQCDNIAETELDQCTANRAGGGGLDNRMYAACKSKVENRRSACYTTARELTDNGKKVAP